MGFWLQKYGEEWGCPPEFLEYQDLCRLYTWKQLDHATNFRLICEVLVEVFSAIDTKIRESGERIGLDQAVGGEVEQWGALVDQDRFGAQDPLYKQAIKARARTAIGQGRHDDFHDVAELIEPDVVLNIQEVFPACVRMFFGGLTPLQQTILFKLMCDVPGLAICKQFVELPDPGELFEWSYLESAPGDPRVLFEIDRHWDHTDGDIPPDQKAGFAYLI